MENLKSECNKQNATIAIRESIEQFAIRSRRKDLFEPFNDAEYKMLCRLSSSLHLYRSNEGRTLRSFCDDYIKA